MSAKGRGRYQSRRSCSCAKCPELRVYCEQVAAEKKRAYRDWTYWGKPVPAFGDPNARVVLVGLAPGAHGSNRTGRMFTGDASGDFLYPALHRAGFATQPSAISVDDGMQLRDCIITAALRCAPPQNKPTPQQLRRCFPYLVRELEQLDRAQVIIGLGAIGTKAAMDALKALDYTIEPACLAIRPRRGNRGRQNAAPLDDYCVISSEPAEHEHR